MKKIITATIGIPAHNEANNIGVLLQSIIDQKVSAKYKINHIIVACDGCTDNTSSVVRLFAKLDRRVETIDDGKRLGQIGRLNNFYKLVKDEVFITFDADTRLGSRDVVNRILREFEDPTVVLVGGNDTPDYPSTLVAKIGNVWVESWYEMRRYLNNGDTVHNHKGCASAGRTSFLRSIKMPSKVFSNDDYLYFSCLLSGHKFSFAERAIVYYKIPTTYHDFMAQTTRFLDLKHRIAAHFGNWVYKKYHVPFSYKLRGLCLTFIRHPILMTFAVLLQTIQRLTRRFYTDDYKGVSWKTIRSTK